MQFLAAVASALFKELPGKAAISAWALLDRCVLGQAQLGKAACQAQPVGSAGEMPGAWLPSAWHQARSQEMQPAGAQSGLCRVDFWGGNSVPRPPHPEETSIAPQPWSNE